MGSKQRLNIYWCHSHFLNWTGGSNYILEITKRLSKKYNVVVVASVFSRQAVKNFNDIGIKTLSLNTRSTNSLLYWLCLRRNISRESTKLNKAVEKKDLIITSMFPMNLIAEKLHNQKIQFCWEPYALFYDENYIQGFNILKRILIRLFSKLYYSSDIRATSKANKLITISRFNKKWIKQIYGRDDSIVSYEGVDSNFFKRKINKNIQLKYNGNKVIFHSTDFTTIKGTKFLFKAMSLIKPEIPNVMLLVSNTLENRKEKKHLLIFAKKNNFFYNVRFVGNLEYKSLPEYLSLADVVVQPSISQSMSLTVKEAMSCGKPIVTGVEGKEQFEDGTAGFLVNPRKTSQLSGRILQLLKSDKLRKTMGTNARKIVVAKFSWDSVYNKIDSVINNLIS